MSSREGFPKVLISDDEPEVAAAWGRQSRKMGFEALIDTRSDVLDLARQHRPQLILLDVNQSVNGLELLHMLKRDPATKDIPVMVISGTDEEWLRDVAVEFGAVDFASKPVDEVLIERVAQLIKNLGLTLMPPPAG